VTPAPPPGALAPDRRLLDEVIDLRRQFHRHPEVGFEEHATSRAVEEALRDADVAVLPRPTETGAVGLLETGRPGRTVMLRADIDGLPIVEESGLDFASATEGRMHACGHDAHTAILLGVARNLASHAEALTGRYLFVFQPAEEIVSGAAAMIGSGLLDRQPADVAIGLHVWSSFKSGTVVTRPGILWSGSDAFEISFRGPGGHGGVMRRQGNVIAAQAFLLERLHTVTEGLEFDGAGCHCSVGNVVSDGAWNIVPRSVRMKGSVRTFTSDLRAEALDRLRGLLLETDTEFDISTDFRLVHGTVPTANDAGVTSVVLDTARELIGDDASLLGRPLTVSDDMAEFLTRIPGCYFMLGAQPPDTEVGPAHHSPTFRIDEEAFATGVRVLTAAAARLAAE
jgi:amidohydrolase